MMDRPSSGLILVLSLAIGLLAGTCRESTAQGPWPQQPGGGQCLTSYYYYQISQITGPDGEVRPLPNDGRYLSHRLQLFCEAGLSERWTAVLELPFVYHRYTDDRLQLETAGLDDQELGVRFLGLPEPRPVSAEVRIGLPWGYSATQSPRLGHNQYYLQGMLATGASIGPTASGWIGVAGGLKHFLGGAGTQLPYQVTSGWHLKPTWMVYVQGRGELNLSAGSASTGDPRNPQVQTGMSFLQGAFSAVYEVTPLVSFQAEYYRDLWGRRSGMGQGFALSLWIQWE